MNTTENNKLIAEFLGWELKEFKGTLYITSVEGNVYTNLEDLQFHNDWNLLMECVEKIESLKSEVVIQGSSFGTICNIRYFKGVTSVEYKFQGHSKTSKLEAVYNACVTFIEWYNKQTAGEK